VSPCLRYRHYCSSEPYSSSLLIAFCCAIILVTHPATVTHSTLILGCFMALSIDCFLTRSMSSHDDEKTPGILVQGSSSSCAASSDSANFDAAWRFLNANQDITMDTATIDLSALRRKVDWQVVPLMFCCYTMQFLDKVILNVSIATPLRPFPTFWPGQFK
jgi:hypothetical protein